MRVGNQSIVVRARHACSRTETGLQVGVELVLTLEAIVGQDSRLEGNTFKIALASFCKFYMTVGNQQCAN
eukprot:m.79800 g.79800  ORF g.79800 m.79800 type:complete len:70 (-) comp14528_c0_seq1:134-343(-)